MIVEASVILPVYNEAACIQKTFDSVLEFSISHPTYHFIFVNDGSTDQTQAILQQNLRMAGHRRIQLIAYNNRQGKGFAVRKGADVAVGKYVCFIDGDLAYSLDHLEILIDKLQVFDVVIGSRSLDINNLRSPYFMRRITGKIFNLISRKILDLHFRDMQAGLKGFRYKAARDLFTSQKVTGFAFDVELLYLAKKKGYLIGEIPARLSDRHRGKNSKVDILVDSIKMFLSLLSIRHYDRVGRYE